MIKSMKGLSFRFFKYNKFIVVSSMVSILLSVFLMNTMFTFSTDAKQSIIQDEKQVYGDMDLSVGYNPGIHKIIDQSLFDQITSQSGIVNSSGVLVSHLFVDQRNTSIYTVGVDNDPLVKSRYHFHHNLFNHEVILNQTLAVAMDVQVGDRISIEHHSFQVKEILPDLNALGVAPDIVLLSKSTLIQMVKDKPDMKGMVATYILIKKADQSDVYKIVDQIRSIDKDLRIDVADENEDVKKNLAQLTYFITVLSFLMLLITSFITISNLEVLLYKYKNQFAIMRSMGATTGQIFQVVLYQSIVINVSGAISGLVLSFISHRFLMKEIASFLSVSVSIMKFPIFQSVWVTILCMLIVQFMMLIPSFKAAKILPIRILQDNEKNDFSRPKLRKRLGYGLLLTSLFFITFGISNPSGAGAVDILLAAICVVSGIFILYPIYISFILTQTLPIFRAFSGRASYVAVKNVIPQVRKNTFIMLMVSTMMMISIFGSSLLKTIGANNESFLKNQYVSDIVVTSQLENSKIHPSELRKAIKHIRGVDQVSVMSTANQIRVSHGENNTHYIDYRLVDMQAMTEQGLFKKGMKNLKNGIVVTKKIAKQFQIKEGDMLKISLYSNTLHQEVPTGELKVIHIADKLPGSDVDAYIDWKNATYHDEFTTFYRAFISSHDVKETLQRFAEVKRQYPELETHTLGMAMKESQQMFRQRWFIFISVMIVILLSVMLGVVSSMINNIYTKRKEFSILRVISLDKYGIIKVIITQVLLYLISGLILGVILGMILTKIIGLIDHQMSLDYHYLSLVAGLAMTITLIVFVPYANYLTRGNITIDLNQDNK